MEGRLKGPTKSQYIWLDRHWYYHPLDTNIHDLILAKLKAYGFSANALSLMHSYLKKRKQKAQINNKFS